LKNDDNENPLIFLSSQVEMRAHCLNQNNEEVIRICRVQTNRDSPIITQCTYDCFIRAARNVNQLVHNHLIRFKSLFSHAISLTYIANYRQVLCSSSLILTYTSFSSFLLGDGNKYFKYKFLLKLN
jgi:hypothetical protein